MFYFFLFRFYFYQTKKLYSNIPPSSLVNQIKIHYSTRSFVYCNSKSPSKQRLNFQCSMNETRIWHIISTSNSILLTIDFRSLDGIMWLKEQDQWQERRIFNCHLAKSQFKHTPHTTTYNQLSIYLSISLSNI